MSKMRIPLLLLSLVMLAVAFLRNPAPACAQAGVPPDSAKPAKAPASAPASGDTLSAEQKEKSYRDFEDAKRKNLATSNPNDPMEVEINRLLAEVEKTPASYELRYDLANAYHRAGHTHTALAAYDEALKLDDKQSRAWVNRGVVLKELGRAADAEESFRKALAVNSADPLAHINLGDELLVQKRYQEAVDAYRTAIKLDATLPNTYYSLAIAFAESGLYRDASRSWRKSAELSTALGTEQDKQNASRALENAKLMDEIVVDAEKELKAREEKKAKEPQVVTPVPPKEGSSSH
jgi:tetratricopeptide (TPR) repeat protein